MANQEDLNKLFTEPSERSDVVLVVEGKRLHANKQILSYASPVFASMFEGDFKERDADEIPLPDKSYQNVLQMLRCIYPSVLDDVTMKKVDALLQLADEYQISALKIKCEGVFSFALKTSGDDMIPDFKLIVHGMYLGEHFRLEKLLEASIDRASHVVFDFGISKQEEYNLLSVETKARYLTKRVGFLEDKYE